METPIYLVEMVHLDSLENQVSEAITWEKIGYCTDPSDIEKLPQHDKVYTKKDCWAIFEGSLPKYRTTKLTRIK